MYFVLYALDKPGHSEVRARNREAHRARLRRHDHPLTVHIGGPLLDEAGAMIGSMLLIEADDRAAVDAFLAGDPYVLEGLYQSVEIRPFAWGIGAPPKS